MNNLTRYISILNDQQRQAVFHLNGPCVVNAVPGSGKTRCLTTRFAKLLNDNARGDHILCCTFTRKAAAEMKERIVRILDSPFIQLRHVGTMHSLFYRMLRDHPDFVGLDEIPVLSRMFSISKYFIAAAKEGFGDKPDQLDMPGLCQRISLAKNELMSPDELQQWLFDETGEVTDPAGPACANTWDYYREYERRKREDRAVDYDDMLYMTHEMFVGYPDILEKWQRMFDYILIDEFQDINKAQWEIIKLLGDKHQNLFVVGDANQSIYQFRGSRPDFIFGFGEEYPDAVVINMTLNYRSGEDIIRLANEVATHARYTVAKIEGFGKTSIVRVATFKSPKEEALAVADIIEEMLKSGENRDSIGVIYRVNRCAASIEVALARKRISYRTRSGDGFFGSSIVKDVLAYLRAAITENDVKSVSRIINKPSRYLGHRFVEEWEKKMTEGLRPKEALVTAYHNDPGYWSENAGVLRVHLESVKARAASAAKAISYVRDQVGYEEWATKQGEYVDVAKRDMLEELWAIAQNEDMSVADLLSTVRQVSEFERKGDVVSLMTIHSAKGLEYKSVLFVGLSEGTIPHIKSTGNEDAIDEERRMFYVGVTRAIEKLYLFISRPRFDDDEKHVGSVEPSRFLTESGIM